jgi:RimJ/RimL family protein N-acetyltransferase/anti-anti-sigma regulatory factor
VTTGGDRRASAELEFGLEGALHALSAAEFCALVMAQADRTVRRVVFDCYGVTSVDVVGIAALVQTIRQLATRGVTAHVRPSPVLFEGLLEASVLDDITVSNAPASETARRISWRAGPAPDPPILARSHRVALRMPTKHDLELFEQWATEPLLDRLVGSRLLYLCRHLGPCDPTVVSQILESPSSLTVMIEPTAGASGAVGFVRLFGIDVAQGFGFLETVVGEVNGRLMGWGRDATRLLVGYARDALQLRRIETKVYAYNRLAINGLLRNGFHQEGILRQACMRDGRLWDLHVFSILPDEIAKEWERDRFPYMGFWPG